MKSKHLIFSVAVLALLLVISTRFSLAQSITPQGRSQHQNSAEINAAVDRSFTYQGVLKENGQPVTGTRDMEFFLYNDSVCTSLLYDISHPGVQVVDGLFAVELSVQNYVFDGDAVWLQAQVGGQKLGCQKITPVPYALSLVPGSYMLGSVTGGAMLEVENQSATGSSSGVWVRTNAPESRALVGHVVSSSGTNYGVYGATYSSDGYGVYGYNPDGVAVGAYGAIQSTADTVLYLSPHDLVIRATGTTNPTIPDVDLFPLDGGGTRISNNSASDQTAYLSIPLSTFGNLLGSQMYVKSVEVCYATTANATIDVTAVMKNNGSATGYSFYIVDLTDYSATSYTCYLAEASAPYTPIDNSSWVQFNVNMKAFPPVYIDIYTVKVTLTQFESD